MAKKAWFQRDTISSPNSWHIMPGIQSKRGPGVLLRPDIPWLSGILRRTCLRLLLWLMVRWHHVHVTPITKNIKAPGQIWQQRTRELGIEVRAYDSALYNCKYINWNTQCARVWHCRHTSYLSQTPRIYSCKFFWAGVIFSDLTRKFGNLLCILP